jgi:hypothetical protein
MSEKEIDCLVYPIEDGFRLEIPAKVDDNIEEFFSKTMKVWFGEFPGENKEKVFPRVLFPYELYSFVKEVWIVTDKGKIKVPDFELKKK